MPVRLRSALHAWLIPVVLVALLGIAAHDIVLRGITHVPEGRRIFNRLTVFENLEMGAYTRSDRAIAEDILDGDRPH